MARAEYEIGVRGRPEDVSAFRDLLKEKFEDYWTGDYEDTYASFRKNSWLDDEMDFLPKVQSWTRYWSTLYPESEAYYRLAHRRAGRDEEYYAGEYKNDEKVQATKSTTHAEFETNWRQECACRGRHAQRNPLRAPFEDCPIRVNPPVQWAIENIMEASEMIGRR